MHMTVFIKYVLTGISEMPKKQYLIQLTLEQPKFELHGSTVDMWMFSVVIQFTEVGWVQGWLNLWT